MTSQQSAGHTGWFTGRTRLITIVSVLVVGIAGAAAVSANIGILDSASDSPVGNASVTGDLGTPSAQVVDVYLPATTAAPVATVPTVDPTMQEFAVDVAGTVTVAATETGLRLDQVAPAAGWSWTLTQSAADTLLVTMTNGTRTLEFSATLNSDGTIAASVNEPIVTTAATNGNSGSYQGDDEHGSYEGGEEDD